MRLARIIFSSKKHAPLSDITAMKEYLPRFSDKPHEEQGHDEGRHNPDASKQGPAFHDLRFLVRESFSLGAKMIDEIDRMLKKLKDE